MMWDENNPMINIELYIYARRYASKLTNLNLSLC